jgi:glyoxylase-like metal-dependent hydrolase (beta-lactamase superfamily II)
MQVSEVDINGFDGRREIAVFIGDSFFISDLPDHGVEVLITGPLENFGEMEKSCRTWLKRTLSLVYLAHYRVKDVDEFINRVLIGNLPTRKNLRHIAKDCLFIRDNGFHEKSVHL